MKKTKKKARITYTMKPKRLVDRHVVGTEVIDKPYDAKAKHSTAGSGADEPDFHLEPEDDAAIQAPIRPRPRPDAMTAVVGAAFEAAASRQVRRRLAHGQALAAIVLVPTAAWVAPTASYFRATFGSRWMLQTQDGSGRVPPKASPGSNEVARDLTRGLSVVGVSPDPKMLPGALIAAADITIRLTGPTGDVLRTAITRFARRSPGEFPDGIAAGLDVHEIVAAFRPGTGPQKIVERLAGATATIRGEVQERHVPDLAGAVEYGEARIWGMQLARDIADYRGGKVAWRDVDRGVCLHSPPGMGKSLFAHILARACAVPLVSTSIGELFASGPGYLDSVIKAMRGAFSRAAALAAPCCILFIDEIDAMPNRETLSERGRDWWLPVINDFLILMDSAIGQRDGIVVVGATNAIDRVDPALLRPGRLEKAVEIRRPDLAGTINILTFHLSGEVQEDLSEVGALMEGSSGAEIMHAVRSARRTARHAGRAMTVGDLKAAVLPIEEIPPARLFRMSIHEAAHAVAAVAIQVGSVKHIALRSRGESGGQTVIDFGDFALPTRRMLEDRVVVGLAARAAERILTGEVSAGAGGSADSDLGSATAMIAALHGSFGMGDGLTYLGAGDDLLRELGLNRELRERVESHLRELEARAAHLVSENREAILAVAERLAVKRCLRGGEIEQIVRGIRNAATDQPQKLDRGPSRKEAKS